MDAREADLEGHVTHDGVAIHYEVHGDGPTTILLLPTWTIVHKRFWKAQLAYLARHFRVVTYDGPGNGRSDRPTESAPYDQQAQVAYAVAVLDATGTASAVTVGLSRAAYWALDLAANHADRVTGTVFVAPALPFALSSYRVSQGEFEGPPPQVEPSRVVHLAQDPTEHWRKYNVQYWLEHHEDFLWFFFGQCFSEPHSTKQIEDTVSWGLETDPRVLVAEALAARPDAATVEAWCERVDTPVLVIHGTDDRVRPFSAGQELAKRTGGELLALEGSGHIPLARDPVPVNLALRAFVERCTPPPPRPRTWTRSRHRAKRALYISSPIGLGHARRDLAIARALRERHPDIEIDWLAQHPVTRVLDHAGERVHPASRHLSNESAHIEEQADEHDLHCFQALREMDEILVANFMVFHDLVTSEDYDLVIGDESWDIDYFLHENPELKRFPYAWFTDFVGMLPMPGGERGPFSGSSDPDVREALVAADVNAQMIEHIERFPYVRDRAIFVGNPDDVVDERFGPGLPRIRDWTRANYDFTGYVTGFDPAPLADRAALRDELGYAPDEQVCVVTVGGSGVGADLLGRLIGAFDEAKARLPALRMVAVAGPRLEAGSVPVRDGLEIHGYVPDLHRHLAASDLAVVQGGLTTCMELTATGRPFVFVPLRHHFEQNIHVAHRLSRYAAGRRLDYEDTASERLAEVIAEEIGRDVHYRPVEADGAERAADLLAEML